MAETTSVEMPDSGLNIGLATPPPEVLLTPNIGVIGVGGAGGVSGEDADRCMGSRW